MLMPTVARYMTTRPHAIGPTEKLSAARQLMATWNVRHLPVLDHAKLVGIVSDRDLFPIHPLHDATVAQAMATDVITVPRNTPIDRALAMMEEGRCSSVVVVDAGQVEGIFTVGDVVRARRHLASRGQRTAMTIPLPQNILVPTDFSAHAERALDYAIALAAKLGATVHVLNVIGVPALGVPELGVALTSTMIDQIVADNQIGLDKLVASKRGTAKLADGILRTGDARDVIVQTAVELGADLIVMGTHGRRGLGRALLGSVAETVVRYAPVPVLTVHADKVKSGQAGGAK